MSGLDSIALDASGFLDMNDFADGSDLPDAALAGLHEALLADPVDEPSDDDWATLLDEVVVPADDDAAGGPFAVDDDASFAGVRDAGDDDPDDTGSIFDADPDDDDPDVDPDDGAGTDDGPDADDTGDDGFGLDADLDASADGEIDAGDLVGFDLLDDDATLGLGDEPAAELTFDAEPDGAADVGHDFEDYL